jgi:hypothetical protein
MIAAAYPRDSFVSCREVPDLRKASFFGYISVMRCIDKNPSRAILHTLSFDYPPDIVRTHNVAICFYIDGDLVGVHSYGYPDDPSLSKKVPCRPIHD